MPLSRKAACERIQFSSVVRVPIGGFLSVHGVCRTGIPQELTRNRRARLGATPGTLVAVWSPQTLRDLGWLPQHLLHRTTRAQNRPIPTLCRTPQATISTSFPRPTASTPPSDSSRWRQPAWLPARSHRRNRRRPVRAPGSASTSPAAATTSASIDGRMKRATLPNARTATAERF